MLRSNQLSYIANAVGIVAQFKPRKRARPAQRAIGAGRGGGVVGVFGFGGRGCARDITGGHGSGVRLVKHGGAATGLWRRRWSGGVGGGGGGPPGRGGGRPRGRRGG